MSPNEYASLGFTWSESIDWVFDNQASFQIAQELSGALDGPFSDPSTSGHVAIPGPGGPGDDGSFDILFSTPVTAFGFLTITDRTQGDAPSFEAFDADDNSLGTVTFSQGGDLVDGSLPPTGSPVVDYGFVGVLSDTPITRVTVNIPSDNSILDDFIFAQVPAPATVVLLAAGIAYPTRRRSRA